MQLAQGKSSSPIKKQIIKLDSVKNHSSFLSQRQNKTTTFFKNNNNAIERVLIQD